ncbi:MAG: GNAT family N-acetyltransferase [Faecalibacterium sp.]
MNAAALTWRLLSAAELTELYRSEMRRDFPAGELKPLSMILSSEAAGLSHTWGVYDGEALAAYLLMVRPAGSAVSQLDYFAVVPAYRAAGLGAQLLAALPQHETGAGAILIEAECPEKAQDEAMAHRRLGFYARCGAKDTGWTEQMFEAWFRVLVLDCPGAEPMEQETAVHGLMDCYRRVMGSADWRRHMHFFRPDGTPEQDIPE